MRIRSERKTYEAMPPRGRSAIRHLFGRVVMFYICAGSRRGFRADHAGGLLDPPSGPATEETGKACGRDLRCKSLNARTGLATVDYGFGLLASA